jgi:hypothetical protein
VLGAHVAQALGNASDDLPGFVRIGAGQTTEGGGFLGVRYNPLAVPRAGGPPSNSNLGFGVDEPRFRRRLKLLDDLQSDYASAEGSAAVADQHSLVDAAARMVLSPEMKAFSLENESESMRRRYGEGGFADGCLLARRLVESGVPFVEVQLGGWDTHRDNFDATASLCGKFDQPMGALLDDLQERGLLESTLVVWMGEFGRTPRINANSGRDHYPKAFNVALGGCGIRGGQVIGETDELGVEITDRPVRVPDLFHTIFHALEIDASEELQAGARPVKRADEGEPVREALLG